MNRLQLDDDTLATLGPEVLVPSRRVQRELILEIIDHARASDTRAVVLPRVRTPDELLADLYDRLLHEGHLPPRRRVTANALRALVAASLPIELVPLADLFESGWRLLYDYELTAELDDLGASHWELVGVVSAVDGVHFYFKRERRR